MKKLLCGGAWLKILSNKDQREAFVRDHVVTHLAFQVRTMRHDKRMSQNELAKKAGSTQAAISRLEDESNESVTLKTLFKIADAFDCAIQISLVPFSKVLRTMVESQPTRLVAASFNEDRKTIESICIDGIDTEKTSHYVITDMANSMVSPPLSQHSYVNGPMTGRLQSDVSETYYGVGSRCPRPN